MRHLAGPGRDLCQLFFLAFDMASVTKGMLLPLRDYLHVSSTKGLVPVTNPPEGALARQGYCVTMTLMPQQLVGLG